MQRLLTILSGIFLALSTSYGQASLGNHIGVKGGYNLARFVESNADYNKFRRSYSVGITFEKQLTKRLSLSGDVLYSRQGNLIKVINPSYLVDRVLFKYDYLTIPFSIRYAPTKTPLCLGTGVQLGRLINHQTFFLPVKGYTNNDDPTLRRTDWGWLVSASYRINRHLLFDIKYYKSFSSILLPYDYIDPITGGSSVRRFKNRYNSLISGCISYYIK